ncbi:transcription initiation factor TFIID subunit 4b isoform X2 [Jatropha curcas]|uniref:transcription initiation factor TFIID subunit 4b isoform X2 n=1 Tax=Jatropha curcas TaxID=180498 RepID=UPI0005FABFE8|nr:transcription initiation factor TFIID subunit 4b isoform X2 [Jatropha curcas]
MDPSSSIMKLLEEDEDETMHSGADVEAFQAALNRDIGGDVSNSQPSDPAVLFHETNQTPNQPFPNWQTTIQDDNSNGPRQQQQVQQSSVVEELKQHASAAENQHILNDATRESSHFSLNQKQQKDDVQQGQTEQVPVQTPTTTGMQISDRNPMPISEPNKMQNPDTELQYMKVQKMGNQQTLGMEQPGNLKNQSNQIPFGLLLPALKPHLDKDREMQLQTIFNKLRKNDIAKDQFVRHMRNIVGDQVLRRAITQLQSQPGPNQSQLQSQALARQNNVRIPVSAGAASVVQVQADSRFRTAENNAHKSHEVERKPDSHGIQVSQIPSSSASIVKQEREWSSIPVPGHSKPQQPVHFPQTTFSTYGSNTGAYPYSGTNVNTSGSSMKVQAHDLQQMVQISHQTMGATQIGGSAQTMNMISVPKFERTNSVTDPSRVHSGSISQYANKSAGQQVTASWQATTNKEQNSSPFSSANYVKQEPGEQAAEQHQKSQLPNSQGVSATTIEQGNTVPGNLKDESSEKLQSSKVGFSTPTGILPSNSASPSIVTQLDPNAQVGSRVPSASASAGINIRTPPKKPSIGQKKPLEALGSSPPMSSKKQKVSGAFLDQSIEQLNDVTAVSGVNLREEEEQLFSGSKEDSRVSEASRRVVQEEEERLILQKTPLQKKLAEIMVKCGLKNINNDVERCLSLCVEERMRGLISNLIRLSKQRVDAEKSRHRTIVTSDVRQQIMKMNQKAREEWEKKQSEAEKLRKVNEPEGDNEVEGDKEKDDGRVKPVKANKEEDDKMRTTAANVAARAAVGGDDMMSKWQLMAEQARQKREGSTEATSGPQSAKDSRKPPSTAGRNMKDNQEPEKRSPAAASRPVRKFGRNQGIVPQNRVARSISVKDVIAALEREPQMSKSTMVYRLYERTRSDTPTE